MSDEADLETLSKELPAIDVDSISAQRMALVARESLGKGPPKRRWILPIFAGLVAVGYGVWALLKWFELR